MKKSPIELQRVFGLLVLLKVCMFMFNICIHFCGKLFFCLFKDMGKANVLNPTLNSGLLKRLNTYREKTEIALVLRHVFESQTKTKSRLIGFNTKRCWCRELWVSNVVFAYYVSSVMTTTFLLLLILPMTCMLFYDLLLFDKLRYGLTVLNYEAVAKRWQQIFYKTS